jgi:hypothetical protein
MDNDAEADYRVKIILLRNEGYAVAEIRKHTNHHDNNIRKWIHGFNSHGLTPSRITIMDITDITSHITIMDITDTTDTTTDTDTDIFMLAGL